MMKALVVVRRSGAGKLGHVGWCFQWDDKTAICGSTENPLASFKTSYYEKGAWDKRLYFNDVVPEFRSWRILENKEVPGYDSFKVIDVGMPNPTEAWNKVLWCKQQDYYLTGYPNGRNCMDDAYDILRAFGCQNLPTPQDSLYPNAWFDRIFSVEQSLYNEKTVTTATQDHQEFDLPLAGVATPPNWRTEGTPEHDEFIMEIESQSK